MKKDLARPKQPGFRKANVEEWARGLHTAVNLLRAVAADVAMHPDRFLSAGTSHLRAANLAVPCSSKTRQPLKGYSS